MKISREFILGDHTLNSHDLSDGLSIDIRRRNFMLLHPGACFNVALLSYNRKNKSPKVMKAKNY